MYYCMTPLDSQVVSVRRGASVERLVASHLWYSSVDAAFASEAMGVAPLCHFDPPPLFSLGRSAVCRGCARLLTPGSAPRSASGRILQRCPTSGFRLPPPLRCCHVCRCGSACGQGQVSSSDLRCAERARNTLPESFAAIAMERSDRIAPLRLQGGPALRSERRVVKALPQGRIFQCMGVVQNRDAGLSVALDDETSSCEQPAALVNDSALPIVRRGPNSCRASSPKLCTCRLAGPRDRMYVCMLVCTYVRTNALEYKRTSVHTSARTLART